MGPEIRYSVHGTQVAACKATTLARCSASMDATIRSTPARMSAIVCCGVAGARVSTGDVGATASNVRFRLLG